ncbi:hypothetical protein [Flavobacterium sp.]|uniref:hypothetical protein n=1 Tax=Flavobacterium sp. TaxID=239 RepID=UPI003F6976AC
MKKLKLLNWFLIILIALSIVGMFGNIINFHSLGFSGELLYQTKSNFGNSKFWLFFISHMVFFLGLFFMQQAVYKVYKSKKFTIQPKHYFNYSAVLLIISAFCHTCLYLIDRDFYDKDFLIQSLSFYFLEIILALLLFAVNDIVKLGINFQTENELTI